MRETTLISDRVCVAWGSATANFACVNKVIAAKRRKVHKKKEIVQPILAMTQALRVIAASREPHPRAGGLFLKLARAAGIGHTAGVSIPVHPAVFSLSSQDSRFPARDLAIRARHACRMKRRRIGP
jgi:hypothetical protein